MESVKVEIKMSWNASRTARSQSLTGMTHELNLQGRSPVRGPLPQIQPVQHVVDSLLNSVLTISCCHHCWQLQQAKPSIPVPLKVPEGTLKMPASVTFLHITVHWQAAPGLAT